MKADLNVCHYCPNFRPEPDNWIKTYFCNVNGSDAENIIELANFTLLKMTYTLHPMNQQRYFLREVEFYMNNVRSHKDET